jgi:non-lysosomal glucosylceramidase
MAAWTAILALSGFLYDGSNESLIVRPRVRQSRVTSIWSMGSGWGTFTDERQAAQERLALRVGYGNLPLRVIGIAGSGAKAAVTLNGSRVAHKADGKRGSIRITMAQSVELKEGDELVIVA